APRSRAVTLYLHGAGGDLFDFTQVPGYDFAAALARAGHASVVVDRLGYGQSPEPNGFASCLGAQADLAHQIVDELRAGRYRTGDGRRPASFSSVAIGGHGPGA